MPGTARRLARRHLPLPVRQRLGAIHRAVTQPVPTAKPAAKGRKAEAKGIRKAAAKPSAAKPSAAKPSAAKPSAGTTLAKASRKAAAKPASAGRPRNDVLVASLLAGRPLVDAMVAEVRGLLEAHKQHTAASLAASLAAQPETATVGALVGAITAFRSGFPAKSWADFQRVPADLRWKYAAAEYVRAGVACDRDSVLAEVRELVGQRPAWVDAEGWNDMLGVVFGAADEPLSREIFAVLDDVVGEGHVGADGNNDPMAVERDWMRPWVEASGDSPGAEVPTGHISFGIMAYGHPGRRRASANLGDHVQSIASLGHLVRHQDVTFHGPNDLVDMLGQLRGRVRPEIQRTGIKADVDVLTVNRDASMYKAIPPNTWTLAFGWYMHAIFEQRYGLPYHHNMLPIFVSFHCNTRDLLTPDTLAYLRRFGPVGCRDWTTVDILLSLDVPAFFSGCMTTTTSNVFPDLADKPGPDAPAAYVDMPPEIVPAGAPVFQHSNDAVRFRSFSTNLYDALDLLETYRRGHSAVVTSRLHCWLPARSIGMAVDFQPNNRSDVRFAGLIDTTQSDFDTLRDGINDKLEQVMAAILSGRSPDDVYDLWHRITASDVDAARQRRADAGAPLTLRTNLAGDIATAVENTAVVEGRQTVPDPVDVAVFVPEKGIRPLEVLLESLTVRTDRELRVWLVARNPDEVDLDELGRTFDSLRLTVVPTQGLGRTVSRGDGRALAPADLDLLALADLLPDVDRVVVLPTDALVTGNVAELAGLDLGDRVLAAPTVVGRRGASGFGIIHTAALRLGPKTVAATDLRHRAYARHAFDFDAFTTSVLVLDLSRMRREGFLAEYLPYVEDFGLTARDVLHLAVGPHRAVVPERWDNVPTRSAVDGDGLLHWADPVKPWSRNYTAGEDAWRAAAQALDARRS